MSVLALVTSNCSVRVFWHDQCTCLGMKLADPEVALKTATLYTHICPMRTHMQTVVDTWDSSYDSWRRQKWL